MATWEIGDEAIVDLRDFSLSGTGMRPVRQSVSRLLRRGYTTRVQRHAGLGAADFGTLNADAASWRGDGGDERGFSMALGRLADPLDGRLADPLDGSCVLGQARGRRRRSPCTALRSPGAATGRIPPVVECDLAGDWPVKTICHAVSEGLGEEITTDIRRAVLLRHAAAIRLDLDADRRWGFALEEIYSELCEATTTTRVFYTDFPTENAPLTRRHRTDPRLAEKCDLVMFGAEQSTAYSELIDPLDQRERLVAQSVLAAAGDPEAMQVDEDFLEALEYGMPPTGGMGMGVDRLVMNLTGLSIRDTILFPLVRPQR